METPSNNQESSSDHNQPFKTLEEELAHKINHLRFRSREFMQNTASHILTNNNPENLTVNFPDIQMTVLYENPSTLTNFTAFLQENMITNQILQDFTYPPKLNESFINSFRNSINQNKSLGLFEGNIKLKLEIPSKLYYGYYFEKIPIKSMQSLLSFIIFEEYVALTSKIQSDLTFLKPNFCYEYNDTKPIEYIPFLSNIYNTILISTEINTNTNDGNLYNIYILLLSETIDETSPQLKKDIRNKTSSNIEAFKEKKFRNTNYLSSVGNINRRIPIVPEKYKDLWTTHIQIPFKSIERLVQAMDSNNDMKITVRDIIEFSHRKFIHLNEEVKFSIILKKSNK